MMSLLKLYFSRRWWWTTLVMLAAVGVMIRLGIWQLDRLESRRTFNAQVRANQAAPLLVIDESTVALDLVGMEYRQVIVSGVYDFTNQIALRNQYWGDPDGTAEYGYHLLTPLVLWDGQAVLVDRGWIPGNYLDPESWRQFDEPPESTVHGIIRLPLLAGDMGGGVPDPEPVAGQRLDIWNYLDLTRIQAQGPYLLLSVYIEAAPTGEQGILPYLALPELDLSEGPHLGYALQWFFYASLVFWGYPVFLKKQGQRN